ncbi:FRG domain-containing protein [Pseudomonas plecoglossicida]|uniref:FRG domain-containing protein n=1 Tax=Pseudomonas plecoglossicida TaxID=70775 RepID=UPI0015E4107C|nr:FRG domain-containing protein [Pseudomonas plecoglossicida]MBA1195586.1 FRG domain-containing protein [Pseudomonas plecoglossicida]
MFIEVIYVETLSEYLEAVLRINNLSGSISGAVYRGQSDSSWGISSGLSRYMVGLRREEALQKANKAYVIFDAHRHAYSNIGTTNPWGVLTLAQHFGMPTRLLDWSLSPMVSLFFALDGVKYKRVRRSDVTAQEITEYKGVGVVDGDYVGLAQSDAVVYVIPGSHDGVEAEWLRSHEFNPDVFGPVKQAEKTGFCFMTPDVKNERIKHQSGVFTVGFLPESLFPSERAYSIVIKKNAIPEMRSNLVSLNVGAQAVYGDLEGLCRDLLFTQFEGFSNRYKT